MLHTLHTLPLKRTAVTTTCKIMDGVKKDFHTHLHRFAADIYLPLAHCINAGVADMIH